LKSRFGYDYIELQLDFSMDLYPFFPPLVKVIRPRLQGSMMLRVTTMEILKLSYWNPARDMRSVLDEIKRFLRCWARLDLQSERNDRSRYPDGAYIDIEHHLLRLALVSEIVPRANKKYVVDTPPQKASLPPTAMEQVQPSTSKSKADLKKQHYPTWTGAALSQDGSGGATPKGSSVGKTTPTKTEKSTAKEEQLKQDKDAVKESGQHGSSSSGPAGASAPTAGAAGSTGAVEKKPGKYKFNVFSLSCHKDSKDEKKAKSAAKNMAKGTGYSSYQQKGWDVKAYMAAQKEKDKQIVLVLGKIHQELRKLHGSQQMSQRNLPDVVDGAGNCTSCDDAEAEQPAAAASAGGNRSSGRGGSRRKRKHSPDEIAAAAAGGGGAGAVPPIDPQSDLYAVLEGSALIPFLESKLGSNSFLEICHHPDVYRCVVNVIREIGKEQVYMQMLTHKLHIPAAQPYLVSLLAPLPDQMTSVHSLLLALETQARILLEKIGKAAANGSVPRSVGGAGKVESLSAAAQNVSGAPSAGGAANDDKGADDKLAREFLSLSKEVTQALKNTGFLPDINGESSSSSGATSAAGSAHNMNKADKNHGALDGDDGEASTSNGLSADGAQGTSGAQAEPKK